MEFKRIRTFERKFYRVCVSEQDLNRISRILARLAENEDKKVRIRVEPSDGKEIFESHDPDFFLCDEMPREVRLVSIKYRHYNEPVECDISFETCQSVPVELSVKGSGPIVSELIADLNQELETKQIWGQNLWRMAGSFWFGFGVAILLAGLIYTIFDLWLDFWVSLNPEFDGSDTHITISVIGYSATIAMGISGVFWIGDVIRKLLPPIQFIGRISDPNAKGRRIIFWVSTLILLPLVISFMPDLAYSLFRLLFTVNL